MRLASLCVPIALLLSTASATCAFAEDTTVDTKPCNALCQTWTSLFASHSTPQPQPSATSTPIALAPVSDPAPLHRHHHSWGAGYSGSGLSWRARHAVWRSRAVLVAKAAKPTAPVVAAPPLTSPRAPAAPAPSIAQNPTTIASTSPAAPTVQAGVAARAVPSMTANVAAPTTRDSNAASPVSTLASAMLAAKLASASPLRAPQPSPSPNKSAPQPTSVSPDANTRPLPVNALAGDTALATATAKTEPMEVGENAPSPAIPRPPRLDEVKVMNADMVDADMPVRKFVFPWPSNTSARLAIWIFALLMLGGSGLGMMRFRGRGLGQN